MKQNRTRSRAARLLTGGGLALLLGACAGVHVGRGDRPGSVSAEEAGRLEAELAPYIEQARRTLPEAKRRYQAGLSGGEALYVTVRLADAGRFEQVYVLVEDWYGSDLIGRVATRMEAVHGYAPHEMLSFKEGQILDWVITKADGLEEGNFVGRFLESYRQ